ncbi:MAG: hypothetical protein AB2L14_01750 [Candidatus Xenobiia bacterium LiM19]
MDIHKSQAAGPHLRHQPARQDDSEPNQACDLLTLEMQFRLAVAKMPEGRELLVQYGDLISRSPEAASMEMGMRVSAASTANGSEALKSYNREVALSPELSASEMQIRNALTGTPDAISVLREYMELVDSDSELSRTEMLIRRSSVRISSGRDALLRELESSGNDAELAGHLLKRKITSLASREGREAFLEEYHLALKSTHYSSYLMKIRAVALKTDEGRRAVRSELQQAARDPRYQAYLFRTLTNAMDSPDGAQAVSEFLVRASQSPAAGYETLNLLTSVLKSPQNQKHTLGLIKRISRSRNVSSAFLLFLSRSALHGQTQPLLGDFLSHVRSDEAMRETVLSMLISTMEYRHSQDIFDTLLSGPDQSPQSRAPLLSTLVSLSTGEGRLRSLAGALYRSERTRSSFFEFLRMQAQDRAGQKMVKQLGDVVKTDGSTTESFRASLRSAIRAAENRAGFETLADLFGLDTEKPDYSAGEKRKPGAAVRAVKPPSAAAITGATAQSLHAPGNVIIGDLETAAGEETLPAEFRKTEYRLISSGLIVRFRRDVFGKAPKAIDEIDRIDFDPEKLTLKNPYEVFEESNIRFTRACPVCGFRVFRRMTNCPDCEQVERKVVMRAQVMIRTRGQSYMVAEDWVEFSSLALEYLARQAPGKVLTLRNLAATSVMPGYKDMLKVVKIWS